MKKASSAIILILSAAILMMMVYCEAAVKRRFNNNKFIRTGSAICKKDSDCPNRRATLFSPKRCCNRTCVYGNVCPWETICRRDGDCPTGQCCDWRDKICKTTANCNDVCESSADCEPGMCCSYHFGDKEPGLCGSEPSEYCKCKSSANCLNNMQCRLVSEIGPIHECGHWLA